MSDAITAIPPAPAPVPPPRRGVAWLAWLVILSAIAVEVILPRLVRKSQRAPR